LLVVSGSVLIARTFMPAHHAASTAAQEVVVCR
jgi:hypothetical protein